MQHIALHVWGDIIQEVKIINEIEGCELSENENKCNITNEEGTACEICLDGYELKDGLCYEYEHCVEQNDEGDCLKCQNDEKGNYCLNKSFGCKRIYRNNLCLECDDVLDFTNCTKCIDGYKNDEYGRCIKINE